MHYAAQDGRTDGHYIVIMFLHAMLLALAAYRVADAAVAPFLTACHAADTKCMVDSASRAVPVVAAGVQQLGLKPLDPMHLEKIGASQAGLDMDFKNTLVKGLRNCRILNLRRQAQKLYLETQCSVQLVGDYKLGGRLLVLPVEGEGKYKIRIRDIVVKIELDVDVVQRGGQDHWRLGNWRHTADVLTGGDFYFQNLFRGNKQLSDALHQFANSNWREIFQEVAPPIVKAVVGGVIDETTKLFEKVPLSELILD